MVVVNEKKIYNVYSIEEFIGLFGTNELKKLYSRIENKNKFARFWKEWQDIEGKPKNWNIARNIDELQMQCKAFIRNI